MKNKIKIISLLFLFLIFNFKNLYGSEDFNFNITEIEILNEGNLFKGLKRNLQQKRFRNYCG